MGPTSHSLHDVTMPSGDERKSYACTRSDFSVRHVAAPHIPSAPQHNNAIGVCAWKSRLYKIRDWERALPASVRHVAASHKTLPQNECADGKPYG